VRYARILHTQYTVDSIRVEKCHRKRSQVSRLITLKSVADKSQERKKVAGALAGAEVEQARTVSLRRETQKKRRREADAASLEDTAVRNNYVLGLSYFSGEDCVGMGETYCKDRTEADNWFCKAAEKGHADAQFFLGFLYDYGDGVEKSCKELQPG